MAWAVKRDPRDEERIQAAWRACMNNTAAPPDYDVVMVEYHRAVAAGELGWNAPKELNRCVSPKARNRQA